MTCYLIQNNPSEMCIIEKRTNASQAARILVPILGRVVLPVAWDEKFKTRLLRNLSTSASEKTNFKLSCPSRRRANRRTHFGFCATSRSRWQRGSSHILRCDFSVIQNET